MGEEGFMTLQEVSEGVSRASQALMRALAEFQGGFRVVPRHNRVLQDDSEEFGGPMFERGFRQISEPLHGIPRRFRGV